MFSRRRKQKAQPPKQSKPKGIAGRALSYAAKRSLDVACVLLTLAALLQISIITAVEMGMEIPVPSGTLRRMSRELSSLGLKAECDRAYFDLDGGLRFKNLRVTDESDDLLFTASQVYAHVSTARLQSGDIDLDTVLVDNASIVLPAFMSESGTDAPLARNIDAMATIRGATIHVGAFQTIVASMPVNIENGFDIRPDGLRAKETGHARKTVPQVVLPVMKRLESACHALDDVEGPMLSITPDVYLSSFGATVFAKGATHGDWKISGVTAGFSIGKDLVLRDVRVRADSLEGKAFSASTLQARPGGPIVIPTDPDALKNISVDASFIISGASYRGETASGVVLYVNKLPGFISARAAFRFDGEFQRLAVSVIEGGTAEIDYELSAGLETCARLAKLPKEQIEGLLVAPKPFRIEGHASVPAAIKGWKTDFVLRGLDLTARGYHFDDIYAKGTARHLFVKFGYVLAHSGLTWAEGTYSQDLSTMDWRMDLKGEVFPPELAPLLGHWWDGIWTDFAFDGPRVNADLTISGNWKERRNVFIKGSVSLKHILYGGARVESGTLDLSMGEGFVDLCNLTARTEHGDVGGRLSWLLRTDDTLTVVVDMSSDVPVEILDKAFGSTMSDQLPDWNFADAPKISMRGNFEKLSPGVWKNEIYAEGVSGRGSWRGIPFDHLAAKIWYGKGRTVVGISDCSLMNGKLTGRLDFTGTDKGRDARLDLTLDETDFTPTVKALQSLAGKKSDADAQEKAGKVDLTFSGTADANDFSKTLDGGGRFTIHDAELGKIKVFGSLSTLLEGIGLNAGTFSVNTLNSNFSIYKGLARFRHSELSGPAIRIEARGSMALEGGDMDFDAKVFLLSGSESPLVNAIGAIITPVGYISELSLKGTMDEPTWRFKLDPRNLFTGKDEQKPAADTGSSQVLQK